MENDLGRKFNLCLKRQIKQKESLDSCVIGKCETCGKITTTESYGKEFCSFACLEAASLNFKPKEKKCECLGV